jgi:hypothetical protein
MTAILRRIAALSALIACLSAIGMAQAPLRTKMVFNINVSQAVSLGGNLVLAPGQYVLYQDSQMPELFALYPGDLTHAPIAQIFTTRTPYWADRNRGQTQVELRIDERSTVPMLKGWTVPFADCFNVVSVKAKADSAFITRVQ